MVTLHSDKPETSSIINEVSPKIRNIIMKTTTKLNLECAF